jgi:DNA-binding transcriptional LysR family regulator
MLDFRHKVFYILSQKLHYTRAAKELLISQPAVTKHIQELEKEYKISLFERIGNKQIVLSAAGKILYHYVDQIQKQVRELEYELGTLMKSNSGLLKIGASTTLGQYVMAPLLAQFKQKFQEIEIHFTTGNTEEIENYLIHKEIDLGIIEGITRNQNIHYQPFLEDELVLVSSRNTPIFYKDSLRPEELKDYPILLREPGSGTLDVIENALKQHSILLSDLKIEIRLDSTEAIKSYLLHSHCISFLSIYSLLRELKSGEIKILDIKGLEIKRAFHFIRLQGQASTLAELFLKFSKNYKPD